MNGGHRGPGSAAQNAPNVDDYSMEFGYKNIAEAPTTAPPATTWTGQEQPDLQR